MRAMLACKTTKQQQPSGGLLSNSSEGYYATAEHCHQPGTGSMKTSCGVDGSSKDCSRGCKCDARVVVWCHTMV